MKLLPVVFDWREVPLVNEDGEIITTRVMVPQARYRNIVASQFHLDEEYPLAVVEARSMASHRHYFASLNDGFHNLPENIAARFPTAEHLRKYCLVEEGFFDEKEFEMDTAPNARKLGTFIRTEDEYARISIHGRKVIVRRAKSQSLGSMSKQEFEASKAAVLERIASMIGVSTATLKREAGRSA